MVKTYITVIIAILLVAVGTVVEQIFVKKEFQKVTAVLEILYEKVDNEVASKQDVYVFEKVWLNKKHRLHAFIPHNEIKEIDLWIGETLAFIEQGNYDEAITKLEVVKLMLQEIPRVFTFKIENIF